ncbi:MAG: DUF2262 domain-containing protein [Limisphaerales bacterium]
MHPTVINDPVFGELKFDPTDYLLWYKGVAQFAPDEDVEIIIYTEGGEPFEILHRARTAFAVIQHREPEYRRFAAQNLLAAYNGDWNEGQPIDAETFVGRISLCRFSFHPDGKAQLDYDDDDMFLGHSIAVRLNEDLNVSEVGLEG